jgi:hypothetical protein
VPNGRFGQARETVTGMEPDDLRALQRGVATLRDNLRNHARETEARR